MVTRARAGTRASSISVSLTVTTTLRDTESHFSIVKTVRVHILTIFDINILVGPRGAADAWYCQHLGTRITTE